MGYSVIGAMIAGGFRKISIPSPVIQSRIGIVTSSGFGARSSFPVSDRTFSLFCASLSRKNTSCTSQRRCFATRVQAPLTEKEFFNREKEIDALKKVLDGEPQFSIISGPVDSGKTSLLLKLLKELSEKHNRPILHINLRERSFDSVNSFASSLGREMSSWLSRFADIAKRLKLDTTGYGFSLQASLEERTPNSTPIDRLNDLFEAVSKQLPFHSWWSGAQSPILFIDEASKLGALLKDGQGHAALTNLFEWFVMNTKETHRFHVILGSSDSFFHLWVQKFIGSSRFTSFVIGDLPCDEAERYWKERVITNINSRGLDLSPPKFAEAYTVCGGNMFLLKRFFSEFHQLKGNMLPKDFSLVGAERSRLVNALFTNKDSATSASSGGRQPLWTREQFIYVMKELVNSETGFLIYEDLCKKLGQEVVDSLIVYNLLHLRPTRKFSNDLPMQEEGRAILIAETPSSRLAMKGMLEDIGNGRI